MKLVKQLAAVEKALSKSHGGFDVFALLLREDAPNRWDLLVSAPWLHRDEEASLKIVADAVTSRLSTQELILLSRLVIVETDDPGLEAFRSRFSVEHGCVEVRQTSFFDMPIEHAYIMTSQGRAPTAKRVRR